MNTYDDGFRVGWSMRGARADLDIETERRRLAEINKPFPGNAPELMKPVKVRVLKAFGIGARGIAEPGTTVELPRHDALSMAAIGRVELLK